MRFVTFFLTALALMIPAGTVWGGLIVNGDFELGNVGFTTQYTYTDDLTVSGTIVVDRDPKAHNFFALSYGDHTSGHGKMLIANGAAVEDVTIWQQTVSVTPNTNYVFCYWLSTWDDSDIRRAQIRCTINGVYMGTGWAPETGGEWTFVFHRWNSGSNTTATIRLFDFIRAEVANDFAIDDIDMFDVGDNYLLVTYSTLGGSVTVPGEGVFIYAPGESVDLQAVCESGYEFAGWGGEFFDVSHTLHVDMTTDRVAIAQFKKLDYGVNMQGSGAAPNEFTTCDEEADRLAVFQAAADASLYPGGLVLGQRTGVCSAKYLFPILKPAAGVQGITKIVVNVYSGALAGGAAVKVGDNGPYTKMYQPDLHLTFTGIAIAGLLRQPDGPVYWLPVEANGSVGALDVQDIYVCYDCSGVSKALLRRFHDHLSIYQAIEAYARSQDIRDLFNRRVNSGSAWETVVQTSGLAQDLGGYSATLQSLLGTRIDELKILLSRWQSLADSPDLTILPRCNSEAILTCLDTAVRSGGSYVTTYANAIADGRADTAEVSQIDRGAAQFNGDMGALNVAMSETFRCLGDAYRAGGSQQFLDTTEKAIRAMSPWLTGEHDEWGFWTLTTPTYIEETIRSLQDIPAEDIAVP
jgi:hypothetical protein